MRANFRLLSTFSGNPIVDKGLTFVCPYSMLWVSPKHPEMQQVTASCFAKVVWLSQKMAVKAAHIFVDF